MKPIFILAAGMAAAISCGTATSAFAQQLEPEVLEAISPVKAPESAENKPVCRTHSPLGSRVPRKICQTREQWALQGVDVGKAER